MADFDLFNPSGLLSPEQEGAVRSRALMQLGAGLLKGGGPSLTKAGVVSGLGEGVQGLLGGIDSGTNEALKQTLMRGQIAGQQLSLAQQVNMLKVLGLPVPPALAQYAGGAGGAPGPAAAGGALPPGAGSSAPVTPGPATPQNVTPTAGAPGVTGIPWTGTGAAPQLANGTVGGPVAAPAAPAAPGGLNLAPQILNAARTAYALGGPKGATQVITDTMGKNLEDTPDMKNARASGFANPRAYQAAVEGDKKDLAQEDKLYGGLQAQGNTAATMQDSIAQARSIVNDPKFYSGAGEGANLFYKRFLAAVAPGHENDALPQEAFRKVMAATILHQVDDMKAAAGEMGSSSSRIFASQIEMMEKAAQNPDNSVAANRYLTEVAARTTDRNIKIADMAADWKASHNGRLGPDFEKHLRSYVRDNPLFTREELADMRKVAPAPGEKTAPAAPAAPAATAEAAPYPGARKAPDGNWYVADPKRPGKYLKVNM